MPVRKQAWEFAVTSCPGVGIDSLSCGVNRVSRMITGRMFSTERLATSPRAMAGPKK